MPLPYPTKVVLPFDIATAQDMNERHANDVALADGTGLDDESITERTLAQSAKPQFEIGVIPGSTLGSTGNKIISGIGFTPKTVRFVVIPSSSSTNAMIALGAMNNDTQYYVCMASRPDEFKGARTGGTDGCIAWITQSSPTPTLKCSRVSLDSDGFTINVVTASSAFDIAYEACA